jgi:hypothetical protein
VPGALEPFLQSFEDALTLEARLQQVDCKRDRRGLMIHGFLPVLVRFRQRSQTAAGRRGLHVTLELVRSGLRAGRAAAERLRRRPSPGSVEQREDARHCPVTLSGPRGASGGDEPVECGLAEPIVDLGTRQLKKNFRMHNPSQGRYHACGYTLVVHVDSTLIP